ncbi:alpha/beta fold hydrolase [Streptomyces sp. NPDC050504]|uniref:alpha/beta fold hydrolase n=1 Tax=Streptomyces sp. NPDC050504 TaxID=3365618 RepID=UPI0037AF480A
MNLPRHDDRGSGPAVVLLPGLAATARYFDDVVRELARDHRVITLELPGHGDRNGPEGPRDPGTPDAPSASSTPSGPAPPTVADAADALHALLARLDVSGATLLGWSLGATVAYAFLERHGTDRIRALVSVEQSPRLTLDDDWPHAAFGILDKAGADALVAGVTADFAGFTETLVDASFAAGTEPPPALRARLLAEARRCDPAAVRALLADAVGQDWRTRLPTLAPRPPVLFLHGARSRVYPTGPGDRLADALPAARLAVFAASGHLPFLEEPELFLRTVRAFVEHPEPPEESAP